VPEREARGLAMRRQRGPKEVAEQKAASDGEAATVEHEASGSVHVPCLSRPLLFPVLDRRSAPRSDSLDWNGDASQ
jgi:hypothetical protein